ncbi:hypothetical protein F9K33_14770 [bacterium]|nr:MAG: hypothetical protein F9K33_14770 [bacterium]
MNQKKLLRLIFFLAWSVVLFPELRAGGWDWKAGTEGGYFRAGEENNSKSIKYIGAFSGSVRFDHVYDKNAYLIQFRLRPEVYGPQGNNYSINASATGQYQRRWGDIDINAGISARMQNYQLHSNRLNINTFQLFTSTNRYIHTRISAGIDGVYNKVVLSGIAKNTISSWSVIPKTRYFMSDFANVSAGILLESYRAHTDDVMFTTRSNKGWRFGPELSYEYSKNWLIRTKYLPSKRFSNSKTEAHIEHEINIVVGKNLTTHWSIFMLADYYISANDSSAQNVVYTQTNYENRIHAKLVYNWKKSYSVYVKLAYTKNELIYENVTLSGMQASVGIEIQK